MRSARFGLPIMITRHARSRMQERGVTEAELLELLEYGELRHKDESRLWVHHAFAQRDDNRVCAAVVIENVLVIKTVMIRWEVMP